MQTRSTILTYPGFLRVGEMMAPEHGVFDPSAYFGFSDQSGVSIIYPHHDQSPMHDQTIEDRPVPPTCFWDGRGLISARSQQC